MNIDHIADDLSRAYQDGYNAGYADARATGTSKGNSLLLKGVPLPKDDHVRVLVLHPDGRVIDEWGNTYQAAPLPPHGRLIDADALAAEMKKRQEKAGKWLREAKDRETAVRADAVLSFLCEIKLTLDAAPTVIPAEEGET